MNESLNDRQRAIADTKRLIIKVGSRLLTDIPGTTMPERIHALAAQIAAARARGIEVILVSSGAIATGLLRLGMKKRPRDLPTLQALAAVGQAHLLNLYDAACTEHGFHAAQVLLSADDVRSRKRHLNIRNCLHELLARQIVPVVNENDTVSVDEIRFGDNDRLAALVGSMMRADLTILLTTVDGLRDRQPDGTLGGRIPLVRGVDAAVRDLAAGTDGNPFSVGGMATKLDAAGICLASGEYMWIADGTDFGVLERVLNAEDVGTLFTPDAPKLTGPKRWLAFFASPAGSVRVDEGAASALREQGKSLLPSGVLVVEGEFDKGDTLQIRTRDGVPIAVGISNFASSELERIKGLHTSQIDQVLGRQTYTEVIHRNNLVVT